MNRQDFINQAIALGKSKDEIKPVYDALDAKGAFDDTPPPPPPPPPAPTSPDNPQNANFMQAMMPKLYKSIESGKSSTIGQFGNALLDVGSGLLGGRFATGGLREIAGRVAGEPEEMREQAVRNVLAGTSRPQGWAGTAQDIATSPFSILPSVGAAGTAFNAGKVGLGDLVAKGIGTGAKAMIPYTVAQGLSDIGNQDVTAGQAAKNALINEVSGAAIGGAIPVVGSAAAAVLSPFDRLANIGLQKLGNIGNDVVNQTGVKLGLISPETAATNQITRLEPQVSDAIEQGVTKGIKPTVIGKKTYTGYQDYINKAKNAVQTIVDNKDALNLVDEDGEKIDVPSNLQQFAQAIQQTKQYIYNQYHQMATDAGDAGAQFDATPILNNLDKITGTVDENGVQLTKPDLKLDPQIRQYAERMKSAIGELQGADPETVEARIADLNNSLKGFYEGRTAKAQAQVDGSIADAMRKQLDDAITSAQGEGYQALKQQYGALKAIEPEVNKRAIVDARKSSQGLTDLPNVFNNGEILTGIATMNPVMIGKGLIGKATVGAMKKLNDPNRYISDMFEQAANLSGKKAAVAAPTQATSATLGDLTQQGSGAVPTLAIGAGLSGAGLTGWGLYNKSKNKSTNIGSIGRK